MCASLTVNLVCVSSAGNDDFILFPLTRHRAALCSDGVVTPEVSHARSSPPWAACVLPNLVSCLISAGLPWWPLASTAAL